MKALIITANEFEDMELYYPFYRLREQGWDVTVTAPQMATVVGKHGYRMPVDEVFSEVNPEEYDLLLIPGGKAPEEVRLSKDAIKIVDHFFSKNKPVASICHGVQVLISAGKTKGRKATCWKGIKDDLIAAGGSYTDTEVVVDGNLVSSRMPDDLPAFMREVFRVTSEMAKTGGKKKAA